MKQVITAATLCALAGAAFGGEPADARFSLPASPISVRILVERDVTVSSPEMTAEEIAALESQWQSMLDLAPAGPDVNQQRSALAGDAMVFALNRNLTLAVRDTIDVPGERVRRETKDLRDLPRMIAEYAFDDGQQLSLDQTDVQIFTRGRRIALKEKWSYALITAHCTDEVQAALARLGFAPSVVRTLQRSGVDEDAKDARLMTITGVPAGHPNDVWRATFRRGTSELWRLERVLDGKLVERVENSDFRDVGALRVAFASHVELPMAHRVERHRVRSVSILGAVPDDMFRIPDGYRTEDVRDAVGADSVTNELKQVLLPSGG